MIFGRRRRYFGYPGDLDTIDTPELAASYASFISPIQSQPKVKVNSGKCFQPDKPALPKKFAEQYLHSAIAAQIPALLPPLKNTFHFREYEKNPMNPFHPPQLERHFQRSLYYIWLSKNDREELCNIVDAHLGSRQRVQTSGVGYRGVGNPVQRTPPADFSHIPRRLSVLEPETPLFKNQKSKGIWNHGRSPAMEAICQLSTENDSEITRVTDKDVQECIVAAKLLLGPYAGINTTFATTGDIPPEVLEAITEEHELEKQRAIEQKEVGTKRSFGYLSNQMKYERKILAAMEYYNHLKSGASPLSPPPLEVFERQLQRGKSMSTRKTMVSQSHPTTTAAGSRRSMKVAPSTTTPKRKFNKDNVTEEDYMEFYLHFLGDNEDAHINTKGGRSLTDVSKLRKKLHLDKSQEEDKELADIDTLLREDSFRDLPDPSAKKVLKAKYDPLKKSELTQDERQTLRNIMIQQSAKIPSSKIKTKQLMRQVGSFVGRKSELVQIPQKTSSINLMELLETKQEQIENVPFEKDMGFIDKDLKEFTQTDHTVEQEDDALSSDTDHSSVAASLDVTKCSILDLDCLSEVGLLGTPPFNKVASKVDCPIPNITKTQTEEDTEENTRRSN